jgi:hypothetical protein
MFAVNPYPLKDGNITWLKSGSSREKERRDKDCYDEARRNANLLLSSEGYVDLCSVRRIRNMVKGSIPIDEAMDVEDDADFQEDMEDTYRGDRGVAELDEDRTFELVMKNGLVARLQAYNGETKREWMLRLGALVKYWKKRKAADMETLKRIRHSNLELLNIDEESESHVGQFAGKWEVSRSVASAELYNICGLSLCRTISVSINEPVVFSHSADKVPDGWVAV